MLKVFISSLIILPITSFCFAETIVLKSGNIVEGKILEKTDRYVKIDFEGVPLTYFMDEIDKIEGENPLSGNVKKKKGSLVAVGDATLTYASYLFELPKGWMPVINEQLMQYTHKIGYWMGRRMDSETAITIVPAKKQSGQEFSDFINATKQKNINEAGCNPDSMREYQNFTPSLDYPYKVYTWDCPTGTYGLSVFMELPVHVIFFNLSGRGANANCITPYLDDFNGVISSFRWVLGLNDEEIGRVLKKM